MASDFRLHLNSQSYTTEELRKPVVASASNHHTPETPAIVEFCRQWLSGKETFVVHTSGSTGQPKPIKLSRRQMEVSARQTIWALKLKAGDKALLCMNPAFIGAKMMLVRAMEAQLQLYVTAPESDPLAKLPASGQFDFCALVPLQLEAILQNQHSRAILNRMKAVIIGGAPVSPALRSQLQSIQAPLFSTYGMTETVSHIALQRLNGPGAADYFEAFPEVRLRQDSRGCLIIRAEVTGQQDVVTNDVVEMLDAHRFRWLGRADNIINSGGVKIQLEKIDNLAAEALAKSGLKRSSFAWGIPDERLGQKLVLFIEGGPLTKEQENRLKELMAEKVDKYEKPKAIFYVPLFSLSGSGKILKSATVEAHINGQA